MPVIRTSKQLAQRLPTTTSNTIVYQTPDVNTVTFVKNIIVTNVSAVDRTFSIYVNQSGTSVSDQNAIIRGETVKANSMIVLNFTDSQGIILTGPSAALVVAVSLGSTVTFTLYGDEVVTT